MDVARGGSFATGGKKTKPKASTKDGGKKKEPQSRISWLLELSKSLYGNDLTRFVLPPFCAAVIILGRVYLYTQGLNT